MPRVKRGKIHLKKRRKLLRQVKGYKWGRKSKIKLAKVAALKAGVYAYRDRRTKKREARKLWQIQINASARQYGINYSQLIHRLKNANIELDRKILADLANNHPAIFAKIIEQAKKT